MTPLNATTPEVLFKRFKATPLALVLRVMAEFIVAPLELCDPKDILLPAPISTLMEMLLEIVPPLK
jgi:hypothetical protein